MRLLEALKSSTEYLERAGIEDALVDAELLVLHASAMERLPAYMENPEIDGTLSAKIKRLLRRRAAGEPVQYIIGQVEFLGLRISVGKGVLIPRPETELLVQEAKKTVGSRGGGLPPVQEAENKLHILDLCTGSGCIALALAHEFPSAAVYAADVSRQALKYAKKNAGINGISNVTFLEGSLFKPAQNISFDLIISNPPYIRSADIAGLQREIREWEPVSALDGGTEGLDFYREIFSGAKGRLKKDGVVFVELGFGQAEDVAKIARRSGFSSIKIMEDYAGIERILKARDET
jgi:release factor glutamine methyltransferase